MTPGRRPGRRGSGDPVTRLKNRARREEHRKNWPQALELYTEAIAVNEQQDASQIDVSLYNRIGDIHLQLGKSERAVSYYEQAIRHYTDQDLHTSAIALCNKVLRILPTRVGIYLHLGRLHAATGLDADARLHYERFLGEMVKLGHESEAAEALEESVGASGDAAALAALLAWIVETGGEAAERRLKSLRKHAEAGRADVQAVDEALAAIAGSAAVAKSGEPDSIDDIAAELFDAPVVTEEIDTLDELAAQLEEHSFAVLESELPAPEDEPAPMDPADDLVAGTSALELVNDSIPEAELETESDPILPAGFEAEIAAVGKDLPTERPRMPLPAPFPLQSDPEPPLLEAIGADRRSWQPQADTLEPPTWRQLARAIVLPPSPPEKEERTPPVAAERGVEGRPRFVQDEAEPGDWSPDPGLAAMPTVWPAFPLERAVLELECAPTPPLSCEVEGREPDSGPAATPTLVPGPSLRGFPGEGREPISALDRLFLPLPSDLFTSEQVAGRDGAVSLALPFEPRVESAEQPTNGGPNLAELLATLRHGAGVSEDPSDGSPSPATTLPLPLDSAPPALERPEEPLRPNGISGKILGPEASERIWTEDGRATEFEPSEPASDLDTLVAHFAGFPASDEEGEPPTHESEGTPPVDSDLLREGRESLTVMPQEIRLGMAPVETAESYVDPFEGQVEIGVRYREQGELERAMEAFGLALASPNALAEAWSLFLECRTEHERRVTASAPDRDVERDGGDGLEGGLEPGHEAGLDGGLEPGHEAGLDGGLEPDHVAETSRESAAIEPEAMEPTVELESELELESGESATGPAQELPAAASAPEFEAVEGPVEPEPSLEPEASEGAAAPERELELAAPDTAVEEASEPEAIPPQPEEELRPPPQTGPELTALPDHAPAPRRIVGEPPADFEPVRPAASAEQMEDPFLKFVRTAPLTALPAAFEELERRGEHAKALLIVERQLETQRDDLELLKRRAQIAGLLGRTTEAVKGYLALAARAESLEDREAARWAYEQVLQLEPDNGPALAAMREVDPSETAAISAAVQKGPMIDSRLGPAINAGVGATRPPPAPRHTLTAPMGVEPEVRPYDGVAGGNEATLDFEKLVSEFRAELAETTVESDIRSRTELGSNLKSMGLLDDAIRELQAAIREPEAPATAYELLGEAFIEKGQARVATRILSRALEEADRTDRELLGVLYQLGVAYETVNEFQLALDCYERVFSVDIDYRDVKDRISSCARLA